MATAAISFCLIVGVTDDDKLTARSDRQTVKVRLAEIVAPKKTQPFGTRSRPHLAGVCFQKQARLIPQTKSSSLLIMRSSVATAPGLFKTCRNLLDYPALPHIFRG